MKMTMWAFMLTLASSFVFAGDMQTTKAAAEAKALIGMEYVPRQHGERVSLAPLSCTVGGGNLLSINGVFSNEWAEALATCQGRAVMILQRRKDVDSDQPTWRIVDTLLLPPIENAWDHEHPDALLLSSSAEGLCKLRSLPNASFIALTRWGRKEKIGWRTGVEQAWTYDFAEGHIVPMSTQQIECEWMDR